MNIKIFNYHEKLVNIFIALYCFTSMHIIFMQKEVSPILYNIRHVIVIATAIAIYIYRLKSKLHGILDSVTISAFMLLLYQGIRHDLGIKYFTINVIITFLILICILTLNDEDKGRCFDIFLNTYIFILGVGVVVTILRFIGINLFFGDLYPTENGAIYHHYIYSIFSVLCDENLSYLRFCGIFNEPGVVGTVSGLLLAVRKYNIRDKKNIILIISGILSMSTAFFALTIGYFVLKFLLYRPSLKKLIYVMLALTLVLSADYFLSKYSDTYILYVRQKIENLILYGESNRTTGQFDLIFNEFLQSGFKNILIGYGAGHSDTLIGVLSIKKFFYEYGVIGISLYAKYILQIYFKIKNRNIDAFIFLVLYIVSLYQRPYVFNAFAMLILSCGLAKMCLKNDNTFQLIRHKSKSQIYKLYQIEE